MTPQEEDNNASTSYCEDREIEMPKEYFKRIKVTQ